MVFIKEIKNVFTENHLFDNQDESFVVTTFWKIWALKILMQRIKSMVFQLNSFLQEYDISFEVLIDELKHVVAEEIQFE